ncbi:MAG: GNAT family protein [Brumimicrobium sp.]|nr:GNAT family protein [Brumimicrobium sp.]
MLKGENIFLRQPDSSDATTLLFWENNISNWRVSETEAPYSMHQIISYIEAASEVRNNKQVRMIICENGTEKPLGNIDLYDISFKHKRAGVGILIADKEDRKKGFAAEALVLIQKYAKDSLELKQLHCIIQSDNTDSFNLFEKQGFEKSGERKKWYIFKEKEIDAYFYQKFL